MEKQRNNYFSTFLLVLLLVSGLIFSSMVSAEEAKKDISIGITQIVEHPALDDARAGFKDVLEENGYIEDENVDYDYQNAQGDMSNANTIAQKFNRRNPDLILSIATPTSQAVANTVKDTPILITAVTDPTAIGVESLEKPNINVSGTTDLTPIDKQMELLLELVPDAQDVGTIYNAGEANSQIQLDMTKKACEELGLTLHEATADSTSNIKQSARSLADDVDAFYVFTDNTVVSAIDAVVQVAEDNDLPLIVGEESGLSNGALATEGINYYELGRQTGQMALRILDEGAKPENMPIESQTDTDLVLNLDTAEKLDIDISEELIARAAKIYVKGIPFIQEE